MTDAKGPIQIRPTLKRNTNTMTIDSVTHDTESNPTSKLKALPPFAAGVPKRILLVDSDEESQQRRAVMLRQRGVEVTCADDIEHARLLWQEDTYSLVMIDATDIHDDAMAFHKSIKEKRPKQMVKFFVGKPGLLSDAPLESESSTSTERKIRVMKNAQTIYATASNKYSRGTSIKSATSRIATQRSLNQLQSADRATAKVSKELSFGEAVRRAEGE
jgi:response regulator RpfG family c-di-GMP phosphodiesterase